MRLRFTKMHGLGNDFIMLDGVSQKLSLSAEKIRRIADRNFGIGCDQVLLVEAPRTPYADFRYRIFNSDGSEVENCGNGARCFALFVQQRGLCNKNTIVVETQKGNMVLNVLTDKRVSVDMGVPQFEPKHIPFRAEAQATQYPLSLQTSSGPKELSISAVSMGNPHAVTVVDRLSETPVAELGAMIENHADFPERVNVGFLEIISRSEGKLRVFERGVGETLACGTGACAAMVVGRQLGLFHDRVTLHLNGGDIEISWVGNGQTVIMTGPATTVFIGQIKI